MSTIESRLKPCPFCGGKAKFNETIRPGWKYIICMGCSASMKEFTRFKSQVASMWNSRKP